MIFVTVGTPKHDFSRLIRRMDSIAKSTDMFMQIGNTKYVPSGSEYKRFLSRKEFEEMIAKSDIVVTHAGVGTIIDALNAGKRTVVVPRRKKFGEHVNDHQMDITRELEKEKMVVACYDVDKMKERIREAKNLKLSKKSKEKERLFNTIEEFLNGAKNEL